MNQSDTTFTSCLGHFATGVTVVTTKLPDGMIYGVTVSSFNSVSLNPPLILFSLDRSRRCCAYLHQASGFVVNVLSRHQKNISDTFAGNTPDRWGDMKYTLSSSLGLPIIQNSLVYFECTPYAIYPGGDHDIFLGHVIAYEVLTNEAPLVYYQGGYVC